MVTINCQGWVIGTPQNTNGYWDVDILLLSVTSKCNLPSNCTILVGDNNILGVYNTSGNVVGTHTVYVQVKKNGTVIYESNRQITTNTNGDLVCVLLNTGIISLTDDWRKSSVGKNWSFTTGGTYEIIWANT